MPAQKSGVKKRHQNEHVLRKVVTGKGALLSRHSTHEKCVNSAHLENDFLSLSLRLLLLAGSAGKATLLIVALTYGGHMIRYCISLTAKD